MWVSSVLRQFNWNHSECLNVGSICWNWVAVLYRKLTANEIRCNIPISRALRLFVVFAISTIFGNFAVVCIVFVWSMGCYASAICFALCTFGRYQIFSAAKECVRARTKNTTTTKQTWTITTHSFHSHQLDLARTLCVEIENSSLEPNI